MDIKNLKKKAVQLKPIIRIGKKGITPALLYEINKHLKLRKLVKIKILKSCKEKYEEDKIINIVLDHTNTKLVSKIGNTFTIFKN